MKLEDLKKLCEAATPGPWSIEPRHLKYYPTEDTRTPVVTVDEVLADRAHGLSHLGAEVVGPEEPGRATFTTWDAAFIAAARTALPKLIALAEVVERYRVWGAEVAEVYAALNALEADDAPQ